MTTFLKIIKAMKCDRYLITNNMILGSNQELSYLAAVYDLNNGIPDNIDIRKEYIMEVADILTTNPNANIYELLLERCSISAKIGVSDLAGMYERVMYNSVTIPVIHVENMKLNDEFNNILTLKAADGARILNLDGQRAIYIYPSLLGINKSDFVSLNYYDGIGFGGASLCEFIIDKKFVKIHKYIMYISLR